MEWFNILTGVSSILGLVISCITLAKVVRIDKSRTENKLHSASIGGDYVGRDKN